MVLDNTKALTFVYTSAMYNLFVWIMLIGCSPVKGQLPPQVANDATPLRLIRRPQPTERDHIIP